MKEAMDRKGRDAIERPVEPAIAYPGAMLVDFELLALIRGNTFFAANRQGDLTPPGAPHVGLFHQDTRFLSSLELRVNGQEPIVLSSTTASADISRIELTVRGSALPNENLDLPVNTVYIHREQILDSDHFYDVLEIRSFHDAPVVLQVELTYAADFMDIFQVRGLVRGKSGRYSSPEIDAASVRFVYEGLDARTRATELCFEPRPKTIGLKAARWEIHLGPHAATCIRTTILMQAAAAQARSAATDDGILCEGRERLEVVRARSADQHSRWRQACTEIRSDNEIFNAMLKTATEDFYSLRMPEPAGTAIAAGVPWFAALFGRDSLLSSYETLLLDPDLARGTLRVLASYQGAERNDQRDEDPGKILHERRSGEMTATAEVPFGRNYGSVDATPLFLILMRQYFSWTGDLELLRQLREPVKAATKWILDYGDLDGDGLIEYCRRSPKGLFNQGWKDSSDANRHSDGSIAQPPIALVEVQGYAARALSGSAELLELLGEKALAPVAAQRAEELRLLIEQKFWLEDRQYYAMALDRDKQPLRVDGSNPGHLLFAGAISRKRAQQVTTRLLQPAALFSGWGIRTLSSAERSYNPMSYHCGSVWPHDNALIGYGMARYGFHREAALLFHALYDAALHFREYRLPELFCGIERQLKSEPVHYPVSCSPQAWAAGAPFLLLTGLLGLQPDASHHMLTIVDPHLPSFLSSLRVENLRVGSSRIALHFERDGDCTHCDVVRREGSELKVSMVFH